MTKAPPVPLLVGDRRSDGRRPDEVRPIEVEIGVVTNADGSAVVSYGRTRVVAAVYGPKEAHPRHLALPDKAIMRVRYHMAPFSTKDERKNPAPSRREIEISRVLREALEPSVFLEHFPRSLIDVFLEVVQADGSTRAASLTAASLALADAGIPMRDLVIGVSVGLINGTIAVDLNSLEDQYGEGDLPIGIMPNLGHITLFQLDGSWTRDRLVEAVRLAYRAVGEIYGIAREALKKRYFEAVQEAT